MNVLKSFSMAALAAVSALAAVPAEAVTLRFTLTGDYSAVWNIQQNPAPDGIDAGFGFSIYDAQGSFPGFTFDYVSDVDFYTTLAGGGFALYDVYSPSYDPLAPVPFLQLIGPQLFSGTEASPTFLLGNFQLVELSSRAGNYNLNIAECTVCTAVPEPDTWAMMLIGFGAVGGALRSCRRIAGAVNKVKVTFA